jgi:uncharacterized protein
MTREDQPNRDPMLAHRASPWAFPVCYLGWAYLFWVPVVAFGDPVWSLPNVVFLAVGGLSPLLSGLLLLWLVEGRTGVRDLRNPLLDAGRIGP